MKYGGKIRILTTFLGIFLFAWLLNKNFFVFSQGNKECFMNPPADSRQMSWEGCGFQVNQDPHLYLGIFREIKKIHNRFYIAVDSLEKTDWFYLGEGDMEDKIFIIVHSKNKQGNGEQQSFIRVGVDEEGMDELRKYKGSYVRLNILSTGELQEQMSIPLSEAKDNVTEEKYYAFKDYVENCYLSNNFLVKFFNFCSPYAVGIEFYE